VQNTVDIIDQIQSHVKQQIELYGDDLILPGNALDIFQATLKKTGTLESFFLEIQDCQKCALGKSRKNFVFGAGPSNADIMLIGEAPGEEEDRLGVPFVGKAGQLLDKILKAINLDRNQVYIAKILKCRPPSNRTPTNDEIAVCLPYLMKQIDLIRPKFLLALGRVAGQTLLETTQSLAQMRGTVYNYHGAKLIVTYHPAALLRDEKYKRPTWEDVKLLRRLIDAEN